MLCEAKISNIFGCYARGAGTFIFPLPIDSLEPPSTTQRGVADRVVARVCPAVAELQLKARREGVAHPYIGSVLGVIVGAEVAVVLDEAVPALRRSVAQLCDDEEPSHAV